MARGIVNAHVKNLLPGGEPSAIGPEPKDGPPVEATRSVPMVGRSRATGEFRMEGFTVHTETPAPEIMLRFGAAVLFGMILGLDREIRRKPAGLRTHMLISLGAAVTTLVGFELFYSSIEIAAQNRSDLLRIIEGVIAAIGFLGAGAIISSGRTVQNMTTAANIWVCGAIGLACGAGYYIIAGIALVFTIVILTLLGLAERAIKRTLE